MSFLEELVLILTAEFKVEINYVLNHENQSS